ncbi:MAG TPA: hypothetical protein EYG16_02615 [Deltaproteobacteria bacterium]|nr:hypothetical protein [Candidatus Binatota bacterium]HIL12546.1 hypothetical protein [Deltaproteobacteria bacterium]
MESTIETSSTRERKKKSEQLSSMVCELNEVRMRLDSLVNRIESIHGDSEDESLSALRATVDRHCERMRDKLVQRMPA